MNRFQKMRKVCKGYLERIPPLLMQGFQWGADWLREKILDLGEYLKRNSLRILALNTPYVIIFYLVDKEAWLYQYCQGDSSVERLMVLLLNFQMAFTSVLPSIEKMPLLAGFTGALAVKLLVMMKMKNAKKFRQGEEYGSARWGNAKDIAPFIDPIFENNILLTMTERLTMNSRPKLPKFARNKNVIVIGGSGSGKTRFYVKPNLMQMGKYISYVVTDPKGTIIIECGMMLVRNGYKIKVLNTINFSKSMHYNPFHYIRSEKDILKLVNTIMVNVTMGEVNGHHMLTDCTAEEEKDNLEAIFGQIDWEECTRPDYKEKYFRAPKPLEVTQEGLQEAWVAYANEWVAAKEVTVAPGAEVVLYDQACYCALVTQGHGTFGVFECEAPGMLRFGDISGDEFFVSESAAKQGIRIKNMSSYEPLVILQNFANNNEAVPKTV